MANVDLHGIELKRIASPLPPFAIGLTTTVGLVGSAPDAAGEASAVTVGAGNAALAITADTPGVAGDDLSISIAAPGGALAIAVANGEIQVTPAAASTAAQVIAAINASVAASALVTASLPAGSTGADAVAAVAKTALAGGVNPPLPLNTPVLLARAALIASIGDAGSLPAAVRDVFLTAGRGGATVVVVRAADDAAATLAGVRADRTGVYALLDAESETGQRPRLIAAPGAKDAAITTALEAVATDLRAIGVVTLDGATAANAITANPDSPHIFAVWPELVIADGTATTRRPADALTIGHIVRTDRDASFAASPSNRIMLGVLRPAVGVEWALSSRTTTANVLNQGKVTTFIRRGNVVRCWGNRLSDGEFITTRRADEIIGDQVADAVFDYVDRRVDLPFVEHILGRLGGYLRNLVINGHIRAGRAWFDPAFNTTDTLAAGQVTFSYEVTPHDIAEHIVFRASIGAVPSEVLTDLGRQ